MAKREELSNLNIPNHVAIILDGNGRWAKRDSCLEITDICRGQR